MRASLGDDSSKKEVGDPAGREFKLYKSSRLTGMPCSPGRALITSVF